MASNSGPGHAALAELDKVLAERPHAEGKALSLAAEHLSTFRNGLIVRSRAEGRSGGLQRQLDHVNAVISVVLAAHFPLGAVPWEELEKARDWLAEAVAMTEAQAPAASGG